MMLHSGIDAKHLMKMLEEHLYKEHCQWTPRVYNSVGNDQLEILGHHRDNIIKWILYMNKEFRFTPETLGLCIHLLDRFLQLVKVRPKYLHCVAICCLYIAAKTLEEDEVIPSTVDLVKTIKCVCTVAEVLRMEAIILDKLSWNIKHVTAIDFLHIIHGLLLCYYPKLFEQLCNMTPSQHLGLLTHKLFNCLSNHQLMKFTPSTLTLSLISLELEQITPNWLNMVYTVQQMAEISNESFIHCRELTGIYLSKQRMLQTGYKPKISRPSKSVKRKAGNDDDNIYDGIKRLYNEESGAEMSTSVRMSCATEIHQETEGCNLFIPVVNAS